MVLSVLVVVVFWISETARADNWEVQEVRDDFDDSYECIVTYKHGLNKAFSSGLKRFAGGQAEILYPRFVNKNGEKWMSLASAYGVEHSNVQIKVGENTAIKFEGLQSDFYSAESGKIDMSNFIDYDSLAEQGIDVEKMKQQISISNEMVAASIEGIAGGAIGGTRAYGDQLKEIMGQVYKEDTMQMRYSYFFGGNEYKMTDEFEVDSSLIDGLKKCELDFSGEEESSDN
jgi:hypothetical protein